MSSMILRNILCPARRLTVTSHIFPINCRLFSDEKAEAPSSSSSQPTDNKDRPKGPKMEKMLKNLREKTPIGRLDEIEGNHPYQEKEPLQAWPNGVNPHTGEVGGPRGPEPTRYGDWERKGRCSDF